MNHELFGELYAFRRKMTALKIPDDMTTAEHDVLHMEWKRIIRLKTIKTINNKRRATK